MINIFSSKYVDQILGIEKTNFGNLWNIKQFYIYSMQSSISLSYVYSKSSKVIGYLLSMIIIDEVDLHNVALEKKYQNNKVGLKLIMHLIKLRYVDGNDASSILLVYINILKNSDKFFNVDC